MNINIKIYVFIGYYSYYHYITLSGLSFKKRLNARNRMELFEKG